MKKNNAAAGVKRKLRKILVAVAATALILWIARAPLLRAVGGFLDSGEEPKNADLIYVFSGGAPDRCERGAQLYSEGRARLILTAGGIVPDDFKALGMNMTDAAMNKAALVRLGAPESAIVTIDRGTSTLEELLLLRDYMRRRRMDSVVLVTSPYHSRRLRMIAAKVFAGTGAEFHMAVSDGGDIGLDDWWKSEKSLITVQNEYIKLILYYVKYILLSDHPGLKTKTGKERGDGN